MSCYTYGGGIGMMLTTERLFLRKFVASDWPGVLVYQADPGICAIPMDGPNTRSRAAIRPDVP